MATPITGLLIQLVVILVFSRLCAYVFNKIGQPRVVGEMLAGIILGQSVFALIWPEGFDAIFPADEIPRLYFLSQLGLIFFMFVVGLDLKISELRSRISSVVLISHSSIVFPFLLGGVVSFFIYDQYAPQNFSFSSFALFMGIAMSITAFPVLARIIQEKRMSQTPIGVMALACAAIDDLTAWCLLAAIVGIIKAGTASAALGVVGASIVYVMIMFKIVRPVLAKSLKISAAPGELSQSQTAIIFGVLLGSSLLTEVIGIHALFGAFLAGTIMPQDISLRSNLIGKIEDFCTVILLPIFFVYTGLRMEVGLLTTLDGWRLCGLITSLAIVGKMIGAAVPARLSGLSWRDSFALGTLMNTRGLMELVVLNIGYDIGILSPTLFTIMVMMAIMTTIMTGPLLNLILPKITTVKI